MIAFVRHRELAVDEVVLVLPELPAGIATCLFEASDDCGYRLRGGVVAAGALSSTNLPFS